MLTWISHGCTWLPHPELCSHLPPHPIPQGHPSVPALSTLFHASNLDWQSVSYMIIYMFQCWENSDDCLSSCFIHTRSRDPSNWGSSSGLLMSIWPFDVIHTLSSRGCHCSKHFWWPDGRESQWTPGVGDGQGGLACCDSWGRKESDTTEWLIWSDLI